MKLNFDEGQVFFGRTPIAKVSSLNVTTSKDASCEIRKFNTPASVSATGKAVFNRELIVKMLNDIVEHQEKLVNYPRLKSRVFLSITINYTVNKKLILRRNLYE